MAECPAMPACQRNPHGHPHNNKQPCQRVRRGPDQPIGHAHPRRLCARTPGQRPDPGRAAVDLPHAQGQLRPDLHPGRPDHLDLPGHRFAAAALDRFLHRSPSQAAAVASRHGLHVDRHHAAVHGRQLPDDSSGVGPDRHRLLHLSPGNLAGRAPGFGGTLRSGAVHLPGRRQHRIGLRPAAGGRHRHSVRPGTRGLVRSDCSVRRGIAVRNQPLVPRPPQPVQGPSRPARHPWPVQGAGQGGAGGAGAAGVLQVFLHGQLHQLLHLLPHRKVRSLGGQFATATCSCSSAQWRPARSSAAPSATRSAARR